MAIGPAIGVSMLLLLWHLRRAFFTRVLLPWAGGWCVGFAPVIWYNLTNEAVISGQVNTENTSRLGSVLKAFVTNAWPRFWGVDFGRIPGRLMPTMFVAALVWVAVLYAGTFVQGLLRWRRREQVAGYQLVFGYLALHLAVTTVSSYGSRFETGTPLSYVGPLYAVAFSIPALVLQSRLSGVLKAAALAPLGLFVFNNAVVNAEYPKRFFASVREHGFTLVTRYPNEANPALRLSRQLGVDSVYIGRSFDEDQARFMNFLLNLECFGEVVFADLAGERYVSSALAVDGARRIGWIDMDTDALRTIGATARVDQLGGYDFCTDFRRDARDATVIPATAASGGSGRAGAAALLDKNHGTLWEVGPRESAGIALDFAFERQERLREIVLFPVNALRAPERVAVEVSDDGAAWRPAIEASGLVPMFWSVWHPYVKLVKPRLEIVLPRAVEARYCRLRFAGSRDQAGFGIREALFLGDGDPIEPEAWEREVDEVVDAVRERGGGAVVVGDHWYVNHLERQGFATDFISNETVTDTGNVNPNLIAPVALDFTRPQLLIVRRAFLPSVEASLRGASVPFARTELRHHALLLTRAARVATPLFWNGLELNALAR
jgi:hypothetical protein